MERRRVGGVRLNIHLKFIHVLICENVHNKICSFTIKILSFRKYLRLKGGNLAITNEIKICNNIKTVK